MQSPNEQEEKKQIMKERKGRRRKKKVFKNVNHEKIILGDVQSSYIL